MTMGREMNRVVRRQPPKMPTASYKTYQILAPVTTHFRPATCAEAGCIAFQRGWTFKKSDLDERLLHIVTHAGKRYREETLELGGDIYLVFEPGQACFQASTHRVNLQRPEFYLAGRGDYRSYSTKGAQRFSRPEDWQDSFANHLDTLANEIKKG